MSQKRKIKSLEELEAGDIVNAIITNEDIPTEKRNHRFVILGSSRPKSGGQKRHKICVPACSFSSSFPKVPNEDYIYVERDTIPPGLFDISKDITLLRIGRLLCIEKYQYIEYCGSLKNIQSLWYEIYLKLNAKYGVLLDNFEDVCDCKCLEENALELEYCSQDIYYLLHNKCKDQKTGCIKLCGCCGYNFTNLSPFLKFVPIAMTIFT